MAWALSVLSFHLLIKPSILDRLTTELKTLVKNPKQLPSWSELEQLPYLTAVILESLRLSYGVVCRLARIAPDEALSYEGSFETMGSTKPKQYNYATPPGSAISILTPLIHHNEDIFPDGAQLQAGEMADARGYTKNGFGEVPLELLKGNKTVHWNQVSQINMTRWRTLADIISLAYCELYLSISALVLRVVPWMNLFETTEKDAKYQGDLLAPRTSRDSKGVRVIIE